MTRYSKEFKDNIIKQMMPPANKSVNQLAAETRVSEHTLYAKKRALVDAALNVGNLSARFTQDVEDMNIEPEHPVGRHPDKLNQKPQTDRPATQKQIQYLEMLMRQHNTSSEAMNKYVKEHWDVEDYKKITGVQASTLIEKFKSIES
jgi:transposase-like protein